MSRPLPSFAADARAFLRPGPRLADELECALSVVLAILFAHLIGARTVSWAAFTGFVVMRGRVGDSMVRGLLRIVGTIAGAGLALLVAPLVLERPVALALVAGLVATGSLYGAMTGKRAYAWLLAGLTFEMILFDAFTHPGLDLDGFARTRLLEVLAGTAACLLVSIVSAITLRRLWPAAPAPRAARLGWHPHALRHAAQGGVAVMLLPSLWLAVRAPALSQSCITIMAVMLVPVTTLGASGFAPVSRRLVLRVAGCVAGAVLAAAVLLLAHGSPPLLIAATCLGVIVGRHIENGGSTFAYVGTQFVLAVLVVLVPDSYDAVEIGPALERLAGILIGMALLEPVLLAWHLIGPRLPGVATAPAGAGDGE